MEMLNLMAVSLWIFVFLWYGVLMALGFSGTSREARMALPKKVKPSKVIDPKPYKNMRNCTINDIWVDNKGIPHRIPRWKIAMNAIKGRLMSLKMRYRHSRIWRSIAMGLTMLAGALTGMMPTFAITHDPGMEGPISTTQHVLNGLIPNPDFTVEVLAVDAYNQTYQGQGPYIWRASGTNDQITINSAISALPAGGGRVLLSEGTFNITGKITIPRSNVTVQGQGDSTIIQSPGIAEDFIYFAGKSNILLQDFSIDGTNQTAGLGVNAVSTFSAYCVKCHLDNVKIRNTFDTEGYSKNLIVGKPFAGEEYIEHERGGLGLYPVPYGRLTATASSEFSASFAASKAVDGNLEISSDGEGWTTASLTNAQMKNQWIEITTDNANKIVFIGDSITDGQPYHSDDPTICLDADDPRTITEIMKVNLPTFTIVNKGIASNTTSLMVARFTADVLNQKPSHCVILGGVVDVIFGTDIYIETMPNLLSMYNSCISNGITPVACTILPVALTRSGMTVAKQDEIDVINTYIRATAKSLHIPLIDYFKAMESFPGSRKMPNDFYGDGGLHPFVVGHNAMARAINPAIFAQGAITGILFSSLMKTGKDLLSVWNKPKTMLIIPKRGAPFGVTQSASTYHKKEMFAVPNALEKDMSSFRVVFKEMWNDHSPGRSGFGEIIPYQGAFSDVQGTHDQSTSTYKVSTDYNISTSTTAGIQEALDALPSTGGELFIPAGTHSISTTLTIPNSTITIRGVGRSSIIYLATGTNADVFTASGTDFLTLKDLAINGNGVNNTNSRGIYLNNCDYLTLYNIYVHHTSLVGLTITNSDYGTIDHSLVESCQHGMDVGANNYLLMTNTTSQSNTTYGMIATADKNMKFVNCSFFNNIGGVYVPGGLATTTVLEVLFEGCNFDVNYNGLIIAEAQGVVVNNCSIQGNYRMGIICSGIINCQITNSFFKGNNAFTGNYDDINLDVSGANVCWGNFISNNMYASTAGTYQTRYSIYISDAAHYNNTITLQNFQNANVSGRIYLGASVLALAPRPTQSIQCFLAYGTTNVLGAEGNGPYAPIAQPDAINGRNVTVTLTKVLGDGSGTVIINGTDQFGNVISETKTWTPGAGGTVELTKIFASIDPVPGGIIITDLNLNDTISVGLGNKLGLDHKIFTGAVKKVFKSGAGYWVPTTQWAEDATYHAVKVGEDGTSIAANDEFQIQSLDCLA